MWKTARKILVVGSSTLIVAAIALNTEPILQTIITPLPKDIKGCLSAKFSQSVEAQQACTAIANVNSVAVWQQTGGNFVLRESNLYENWTNARVGIGTSNPSYGLHVTSATNTGNTISAANRIFLNGRSGTTVSLSSNAFVNDAGTWAVPDTSSRSNTIEMRNTGVTEMYGTVTTGGTDWRMMLGYNAPSNTVYFPNGNVGVGTSTPGTYKLNVTGGNVSIGSNNSVGSPLVIGSTANAYDASGGGWTGTDFASILVQGFNGGSIAFHDANCCVGTLRYNANTFFIGDNTSWGSVNTQIGNNLNAASLTVRPGAANTGGTIGPSTSSWTSYDVSGTLGGYAGFNFTSEAIRLMMDTSIQGVHGANGWLWYWNNGTLEAGTVPAGRISGTVANANYANSAGSAGSVNGWLTGQHTRTTDTVQFARVGAGRTATSYAFEVGGTSWLTGFTCMGSSCSPGYASQASAMSSDNFLIWGMSWTGLGFKMGSTVDSWARLVQASNWGAYHNVAMGALFANGATRFDIAEFTPVDPSEKLKLGELVMPNPVKGMQLVRTKSAYAPGMAGIVSNVNTASMVIGGDTTPEKAGIVEDKKPIALGGRVITIVNLEGGTIKMGDPITSSSTPGTGMKAAQGQFVSKAMEAFDGARVNSPGVEEILANLQKERSKEKLTNEEKQSLDNAIADITAPLPEGTGRIITFVTQGYTEIESLEGVQVAQDGSVTQGTTVVESLSAFAQAVIGKLRVGILEARKIVVDGVDLGKKVQELEAELQKQKEQNQTQEAQIKQLEERLEKLENN